MNNTTTLLLLMMAGTAVAQPSITSSSALPAVGYGDTIFVASGSAVGPAGAGVTWDFSTMSVTPAGTFTVMAPGSAPHGSTFPTATHTLRLTPLGSTASFYEYYRQSATGWEILASNFIGTSGDNYTPNSKLRVPFPFSFGSTRMDTFQKTGSSPDAYTITYDGWGTLKTPGRTLNNVIRLKYQWVGGEIRYEWFSESPLFYLATWNSNNGGTFNFLGRTAATDVGDVERNQTLMCWPNPAGDAVAVKIPAESRYRNAVLVLTDLTGRAVYSTADVKTETHIPRGTLAAGVYVLRLIGDGHTLAATRVAFR